MIFTFTYRSGRETQQFQGMCCSGNSKVIVVEDTIGVLMESLCKFKPVTAVKFWRLRVYDTSYYSLEYHHFTLEIVTLCVLVRTSMESSSTSLQ